jgi:CO dehydrogenase maturation factor
LILDKEDTVILDMGAGIEQLTRGTARGVDALIIVTEPSKVSIKTAGVIKKLSSELGIPKVFVVGNKVRNNENESFLREHFSSEELIGIIPFSEELLDMSINTGSKELPQGSLGMQLANIYQEIVRQVK